MPCPLIRLPPAQLFAEPLQRLQRLFAIYAATSPAPLPSPGLAITPEIRYQSELYLPIDEIRRLFYRYYRASLHHPPHVVSTPFHGALSWADCFAQLPQWCQLTADPGRLLHLLQEDVELHERFIFAGFLPARFNGPGFGRYPDQLEWLRQHLRLRPGTQLRVLDAACGSGEGSWELAECAAQAGWRPDQIAIEGWTLDPLEVYAASNRYLPHDAQRQQEYRLRIAPLVQQGWNDAVRFQSADLLADLPQGSFDLIACNGLLGGPLLHNAADLQRVIERLASRLRPGGYLVAADQFHDGWKKKIPGQLLGDLCAAAGLAVVRAGEGIVGLKADQ